MMKTKLKIQKISLSKVVAGFAMVALPLSAFAAVGQPLPEPDTILLISMGAAAIWVARRIKK